MLWLHLIEEEQAISLVLHHRHHDHHFSITWLAPLWYHVHGPWMGDRSANRFWVGPVSHNHVIQLFLVDRGRSVVTGDVLSIFPQANMLRCIKTTVLLSCNGMCNATKNTIKLRSSSVLHFTVAHWRYAIC